MSDDAAVSNATPQSTLASRLLLHAERYWPNLTAAEYLLLNSVVQGTVARLPGDPEEGSDPDQSHSWGDDRRVRAELLRWLFVDGLAAECVDARGVQLRGVRIAGPLDLSFIELKFPLRLGRCVITEDMTLVYTTARLVSLRGCRVQAVLARHLTLRGSLVLTELQSEGGVDLWGARITGTIHADGCSMVAKKGGYAFNLEAAHVDGSVFLRRGLAAHDDPRDRVRTGRTLLMAGPVRLFSCKIGDNLECDGATFDGKGGSSVEGARLRVNGNVLLRGGFTSHGEVNLYNADIGGTLVAEGATFKAGPQDQAFNLEGAHIHGNVLMRREWRRSDSLPRGACTGRMFRAFGPVSLFACKIDRNLVCVGAIFSASGTIALSGRRLQVGADADFSHSIFAGGADLNGGYIGGSFRADGSTFSAAQRANALDLSGSEVRGDLHLRRDWHTQDDHEIGIRTGRRFQSVGEIRLVSCTVGGSLACNGATFRHRYGSAMAADRLMVIGQVDLTRSTSEGGITLNYANIRGNLWANGSNFGVPSGPAFSLWGARVDGSVLFNRSPHPSSRDCGSREFSATGELLLSNSSIGGDLECDGASLTSFQGTWLKVGNVLLRNGFSCRSTVTLVGAKIGGLLDCTEAIFGSATTLHHDDSHRIALDLSLATVSTDLWLTGATVAGGWLRMNSAKIYGDVIIRNLRMEEHTKAGVTLMRAAVDGTFLWTDIDVRRAPDAHLLLDHAQLGRLGDDAGSWPRAGQLSLAGLRYGTLIQGPQDVDRRIEWLRRQPASTFSLQPYEQLASVFRAGGQESAARRVAIARENDRRRREGLRLLHVLTLHYHSLIFFLSAHGGSLPDRTERRAYGTPTDQHTGMSLRSWIGSHVLRATIGYGYASGRTLIWSFIFVSLGWLTLEIAYNANPCVLTPADVVPDSFQTCGARQGGSVVAKGGQTFNALVYSLDAFLPVGDLRQESRWLPDPRVRCELRGGNYPCGRLLRGYLWLQTLAGWVLTTLGIAGLTGLVRKT